MLAWMAGGARLRGSGVYHGDKEQKRRKNQRQRKGKVETTKPRSLPLVDSSLALNPLLSLQTREKQNSKRSWQRHCVIQEKEPSRLEWGLPEPSSHWHAAHECTQAGV